MAELLKQLLTDESAREQAQSSDKVLAHLSDNFTPWGGE